MNRAWLILILFVGSMSGCTWFGLVEEKPVSPFGIPEKGAITLIQEVSSRTANVEFSGWYVEVLSRPAVRVEGKAVSTSGIRSLKKLMEACSFQDVALSWGRPSEYEETSFGLHGAVSVGMIEGERAGEGAVQGGRALFEKILKGNVQGGLLEAFRVESRPSLEWENEWRCDIVETRYTPERGIRLSLESFLDLLRPVERDSKLIRSVIARLQLEEGKVSHAIVRWHCYLPPGK